MSETNEVNPPTQVVENDLDGESMILTKVHEDGTTSNYFDKRKLKIAPRSTLQFKVGPPFQLSNKFGNVIDNKTGQNISLKIIPRIDRGFDNIDNEWVGYKRNYFTLVTSFQVRNYSIEKFLESTYQVTFVENFYRQTANIKYFAVKIKARTDDECTEINLIQHTAKRDKGPQFAPELCPLIPSPLPKHQIIREASNVRNTNKMKKYDSTFYFHRDQEEENYNFQCILKTYPSNCIQKVARYERVQFASSINVKKPSQQNKHFRLHVVLGAVVDTKDLEGNFETNHFDEVALPDGGKGLFVYLQEMNTPPLIIRGRSPSNYTSSQRVTMRTNSMTPSVADSCNQEDLNTNLVSPVNNDPKSPIIANPSAKKQRVGRPSKRKSKVVEYRNEELGLNKPDPVQKENICGIPVNIVPRIAKRVQTLQEVEDIMLTQLPLYEKLASLGEAQNETAVKQNRTHKVFKDRPASCRTLSVDLKDIELKPLHYFPKDEMCIIGSLALNLPTQSIGDNSKNSHKRQYDLLESNINDGYIGEVSDNSIRWVDNGLNSFEKSKEESSDHDLSLIYNLSKYHYKFDHCQSRNGINPAVDISASIPRSMGTGVRSILTSSKLTGDFFREKEWMLIDQNPGDISETSINLNGQSFV